MPANTTGGRAMNIDAVLNPIAPSDRLKTLLGELKYSLERLESPNYPFSEGMTFCSSHDRDSDIIDVVECKACIGPGYPANHPLAKDVSPTGRLAASKLEFQNIPIRTELGEEIKRAFLGVKGK